MTVFELAYVNPWWTTLWIALMAAAVANLGNIGRKGGDDE